MFSEFKDVVLKTLGMAVKHGRYNVPVHPLLQVLVSRTQLFHNFEARARYSRAYRYVKQMRQALVRAGWDLKDLNGRKHFSLFCPAAREKDYTKCEGCDKRVECLLIPLYQ